MPIAVYVCPNGDVKEVEIAEGHNLMQAAVANGIYDIVGDCGGSASCATCHVYVDDEWMEKLPEKDDGEEDMLDMAFEPKKNSRLSCQIIVSDDLNGLTVHIPSKQG